MKFFLPFDEALLARYPELIESLVPFTLDYACHRRLRPSPGAAEPFTYEVLEAEKPASGESAKRASEKR